MSAEKNPTGIPFTINGNWEEQAKNLKAKFEHLTDGDLRFEPGKENEMIKSMEARLYKTRDEVISIIKKNESETPAQ